MPPPRARAGLHLPSRRVTLLDEIRALPDDKCRRDGVDLKPGFVRFVEDRWDEEHNRPRPTFKWITWTEAWVDFLLEEKHALEAIRRPAQD
jgi:hypothetical protein